MLADVVRRLQESRAEPTKMVFEQALKFVKSGVKLGTDVSGSRAGRRVFPSTWSGMENPPENETRLDGTRDAEDCKFHHNVGDAEFGSPETPQCTGRVQALSGADVPHIGTAAVYVLMTTSRHVNTTQTAAPMHRNMFHKSLSSQHVSPKLTKWKNDKNNALESQIDGERRNRRVRKVRMKLTATSHCSRFRNSARSLSRIWIPCWRSEDIRTLF